ncbi:hypothetical protein EDC94DRAFT_688703 [Helicostylum pulchrum]|nr:hypothetical protein EDC94DRAFT_688703 [Helicostylum pulchrum]
MQESVSNQRLTMNRPRTRAYIKQETDDSKESFEMYFIFFSEKRTTFFRNKQLYYQVPKKKYCSICDIKFWNARLYLDHELHSHKTKETPIVDVKNLLCNICNRVSKTIQSFQLKSRKCFRAHLIKVHRMLRLRAPHERPKPETMEPTFDILNMHCDVCKKTYGTKRSYIRHLVVIHETSLPEICSEPNNFDSKNLYCKVCDIKYKREGPFIIHLRDMHNMELRSLSNSIPDVDDENNYCVTCDKSLSTRKYYLLHLAAFHLGQMPELYQGIDCKNPSKDDLQYYRYCADCQKVFRSKRLYEIHVDEIHFKPLKSSSSTDNDPNNCCTSCHVTYFCKAGYQQHLVKVHNMAISSIPKRHTIVSNMTPVIDPKKAEASSIFVNRNEISDNKNVDNHCTACDKLYRNRASYKDHLYKIHGIVLPRPTHKALQTNHDIIPDVNDVNNYCVSCARTYTTRNIYMLHLNTIHAKKKLEITQEDTKETL